MIKLKMKTLADIGPLENFMETHFLGGLGRSKGILKEKTN
jgi:hypothetical protein